MTLYNRWKGWSDMGEFARIVAGLSGEAPDDKAISVDATYLKAHRTASNLRLKKGAWGSNRSDQGWYEHKITRCRRHQRRPDPFLYHRCSGQRLYRRSDLAEQFASCRMAAG